MASGSGEPGGVGGGEEMMIQEEVVSVDVPGQDMLILDMTEVLTLWTHKLKQVSGRLPPIPSGAAGLGGGERGGGVQSSVAAEAVVHECRVETAWGQLFEVVDKLGVKDKPEISWKVPLVVVLDASARANFCSGLLESMHRVRDIMGMLKTIMSSESTCSVGEPFSVRDTEIIISLWESGLRILEVCEVAGSLKGVVDGDKLKLCGNSIKTTFASLFHHLPYDTFRAVVDPYIKRYLDGAGENKINCFVTERVFTDFMTSPPVSPVFANSLLEALVDGMELLGEASSRTVLYLQLLKILFSGGSGGLKFEKRSELLCTAVHKGMDQMKFNQHPKHYLRLLLIIFRTIRRLGDAELVQSLSTLYPVVLRDLTSFQSAVSGRQELFEPLVEICLSFPQLLLATPVSVSHLPYFTRSLVSALNGSPSLVSKGLQSLTRIMNSNSFTLGQIIFGELFPGRDEVLEALYKLCRSPYDSLAMPASIILGHLGSRLWKTLDVSRDIKIKDESEVGLRLRIHFVDYQDPITLPIGHTVRVAVKTLTNPNAHIFYKKHSWEFLKELVLTALFSDVNDEYLIVDKASNGNAVLSEALTGWIMATTVKEIQKRAYLSLIEVLRQPIVAGAWQKNRDIIVPAFINALSYEAIDLRRRTLVALSMWMHCLIKSYNPSEKICFNSTISSFMVKLLDMCRVPSLISILGGCEGIKFLLDKAPTPFAFLYTPHIVQHMLFVIADSKGIISSEIVNTAKYNLFKLISLACSPVQGDQYKALQVKAGQHIVHEFLLGWKSSSSLVRDVSKQYIQVLAKLRNTCPLKLLPGNPSAHQSILDGVLPPKYFTQFSIEKQLVFIHKSEFLLSLGSETLSVDWNSSHHLEPITQLMRLASLDEPTLRKTQTCYQSAQSLVPFKAGVLKVLARLVSGTAPAKARRHIVAAIVRHLDPAWFGIQLVAGECLKMILDSGTVLPIDEQEAFAENLLKVLTICPVDVTQLSYCCRLMRDLTTHNPALVYTPLLETLKRMADTAATSNLEHQSKLQIRKMCLSIINLFALVEGSPKEFLDPLCSLCLGETLCTFLGPTCRESLIKVVLKCPLDFFRLAVSLTKILMPGWNYFLLHVLRHPEAHSIRHHLFSNPDTFLVLFNWSAVPNSVALCKMSSICRVVTPTEQEQIQYLLIRSVEVLTLHHTEWIHNAGKGVLRRFKGLWQNESNRSRYLTLTNEGRPRSTSQERCSLNPMNSSIGEMPMSEGKVDVAKCRTRDWDESRILVKLFLDEFQRNPTDFDLLIQLLYAFCGDLNFQFDFLQSFLEKTMPTYSAEWKWNAFLYFIKIYGDPAVKESIKLKFVQLVLIPCFTNGENPGISVNQGNKDMMEMLAKEILVESRSDHLTVALCQLCVLLLNNTSQQLANNREEFPKLLYFAWSNLLSSSCEDRCVKLYAHLLLCQIASKFSMSNEIIAYTFQTLLLFPNFQQHKPVLERALSTTSSRCFKNGNQFLVFWTGELLLDETQGPSEQLKNLYNLVVRHWEVYYAVREGLVPHIVRTLTLTYNGLCEAITFDELRLAVDLADVVIKWEVKGLEMRDSASSSGVAETRGLDASDVQVVLNFLMWITCHRVPQIQAEEEQLVSMEALSNQCADLIKQVHTPNMWENHFHNLQLECLEELLGTATSLEQDSARIVAAMGLLTTLLGLTKTKEGILKYLSRLKFGILRCLQSENIALVWSVANLMSTVIALLPSEFPEKSTVPPKSQVVCHLYNEIYGQISRSLEKYVGQPVSSSADSLGLLEKGMRLMNVLCDNNPFRMHRLIEKIMFCIRKVTGEHLKTPQGSNSEETAQALVTTLVLVKNSVAAMGSELKAEFLGIILPKLIEGSTSSSVMNCILGIVNEWVTSTDVIVQNQGPDLVEKAALLEKLSQNLQKRFPCNHSLRDSFFKTILSIYNNPQPKVTNFIKSKLEPAFLFGLQCSEPIIRQKFFQMLNKSVNSQILFDRIMHIVCIQNWGGIGTWIPQCLNLLAATASPASSTVTLVTPHLNSKILESSVQRLRSTDDNHEAAVIDAINNLEENVLKNGGNDEQQQRSGPGSTKRRKLAMDSMLQSLVQLCYFDQGLAQSIWISLFPRLWNILSDANRSILSEKIKPFLASGAHVPQHSNLTSSLNTFVEGVTRCVPKIPISPILMTYLGKRHNLWHCMALQLEDLVLEGEANSSDESITEDATLNPPRNERLHALSYLYSQLNEEDLWAGLWQNRPTLEETKAAITLEQQGCYKMARAEYEKSIARARLNMETESDDELADSLDEMKLLEEHWLKCSAELGQWDEIEMSCSSSEGTNLMLINAAGQMGSWDTVRKCLSNIQDDIWPDEHVKVKLIQVQESLLNLFKKADARHGLIEKATAAVVNAIRRCCIQKWRNLPEFVSTPHLQLLQIIQRTVEIFEAVRLQQFVQLRSENAKCTLERWRHRVPSVYDELSSLSEVFCWRKRNCLLILERPNAEDALDSNTHFNPMVICSAVYQSISQFSKIAREQGSEEVALSELATICSLPKVPVTDFFGNIMEQVKCLIQLSHMDGISRLQEALGVIDFAVLQTQLTNQMTAELGSMRAQILQMMMGSQYEVGKGFDVPCDQTGEASELVLSKWAEELKRRFIQHPTHREMAKSAIACFMVACRKATSAEHVRQYIAKILCLLAHNDGSGDLVSALSVYCNGLPRRYWLPWVPQLIGLISCSTGKDGNFFATFLSALGKQLPQAVYFPLQSFYSTWEYEQKAKIGTTTEATSSSAQTPEKPEHIMNCCSILESLRKTNPRMLNHLELFAHQLTKIQPGWKEELVKELIEVRSKCYAITFEHKDSSVSSATIGKMRELVQRLLEFFECRISETRDSGRLREDPDHENMMTKFQTDFDASSVDSVHSLIPKLRKWINEFTPQVTPSYTLAVSKDAQFILTLNSSDADIAMPGGYLIPNPSNVYVKIVRCLPTVDKVSKDQEVSMRVYFLGDNGKTYPFLITTNYGSRVAPKQERVSQLLLSLNDFLTKRKFTSRRNMRFSVPKVVPLSRSVRLVEDNPASASLLEIFKLHCSAQNQGWEIPILKYYELAKPQFAGGSNSPNLLQQTFRDIQTSLVPRQILKNWAWNKFATPSDYWMFRKTFTNQLCLAQFAEYAFHLTRLEPQMLNLHYDSGIVTVSHFTFDMDVETRSLNSIRPVPFRLTPTLSEFLTPFGVQGALVAGLVAVSRSLAYPNSNFKDILHAILQDEFITDPQLSQNRGKGHQEPSGGVVNGAVVRAIDKAVEAIVDRVSDMARISENPASHLVKTASDSHNLCQMDPTWFPWL